MLWRDRTNRNGVMFRQWHATKAWETPPDWPSPQQPGCPICGERYLNRFVNLAGVWYDSAREYIYHCPEMHRFYRCDAMDDAMTLTPTREPGDS